MIMQLFLNLLIKAGHRESDNNRPESQSTNTASLSTVPRMHLGTHMLFSLEIAVTRFHGHAGTQNIRYSQNTVSGLCIFYYMHICDVYSKMLSLFLYIFYSLVASL